MSVIVMGAELPKGYEDCWYLQCDSWKDCYINGMRDDCPLRPLPEKHGRLIDANGLKETLEYYIREAGWDEKTNRVLGWVKDEFIESEAIIVESEGE